MSQTASADQTAPADQTEPLEFRVTGGHPSDEELAAVMAVLQAATASAEAPRPNDDRPLAGGWKSYARTHRRVLTPGREAWKYSVRP